MIHYMHLVEKIYTLIGWIMGGAVLGIFVCIVPIIRLIKARLFEIKFYTGKFDINTLNIPKIFKLMKHKSQWKRDLAAKWMKRDRKYVVNQEWAEAKVFWDEYEKKEHFTDIKQIEGVEWVTIIGDEQPVKGDRYGEYYVNRNYTSRNGMACKLLGVSEYGNHDELELFGFGIPVELVRCRRSTDKEIYEAKLFYKEEMNKSIMSRADAYYEQIQEIRNEYNWLD